MNKITENQFKELLKIQEEFDNRISTLNIRDTKEAYATELFEWFNTLENFKNWKKRPGKPLEMQLDELADVLAFALSGWMQEVGIDNDEDMIFRLNLSLLSLTKGKQKIDTNLLIGIINQVNNYDQYDSMLMFPFMLAYDLYTVDQLIEAYKKKMKRNHERQNGTADKEKGYV